MKYFIYYKIYKTLYTRSDTLKRPDRVADIMQCFIRPLYGHFFSFAGYNLLLSIVSLLKVVRIAFHFNEVF